MEKTIINHPNINGWGIDIDPKNDPTYPIKKQRTDEERAGYTWERPAQQPVDMEVLHSNERPNVSAVFGTSMPPRGLSGMLRRYAFQYGEGSMLHWLPLLLADRVNEVEGIVEDLAKGHLPNIFAEKGYGAQWKFDRKRVIAKIAIGTALTAATVAYVLNRKNVR